MVQEFQVGTTLLGVVAVAGAVVDQMDQALLDKIRLVVTLLITGAPVVALVMMLIQVGILVLDLVALLFLNI